MNDTMHPSLLGEHPVEGRDIITVDAVPAHAPARDGGKAGQHPFIAVPQVVHNHGLIACRKELHHGM